MMLLNQMQAAFEAAYPAATRARVGDTYGGAFGSMFIVWQQAVASCAPAAVEQVDALTDVKPLLYYRSEPDGSIIWGEDCVSHDDMYSGEFSDEEFPTLGGKAYSEAQVRAVLAAARPAAPVQAAQEGWKLVPLQPTGVMKDAGSFYGLPVSVASPWLAAKVYEAMVDIAPAPRSGS